MTEDYKALSKAVLKMYEMTSEKHDAMSVKGMRYFKSHFER
jgi:hypothetical protein